MKKAHTLHGRGTSRLGKDKIVNLNWKHCWRTSYLGMYCEQPKRWSDFIHLSTCDFVGNERKTTPHASLPGSLFFRLDECVKNIVKSVGWYNVVTHADTAFLHMFISEPLETVSLKHVQFDDVEMVEREVDGEIIEKPNA